MEAIPVEAVQQAFSPGFAQGHGREFRGVEYHMGLTIDSSADHNSSGRCTECFFEFVLECVRELYVDLAVENYGYRDVPRGRSIPKNPLLCAPPQMGANSPGHSVKGRDSRTWH